VIEICSSDAKAAARAAAILKVYHKYVEQGIEGSLARDEASRVIREAERNGKLAAVGEPEDDSEEEEDEEELRTLLLDAEEEVRETFGRGLSVSGSESEKGSKSPEAQEDEDEDEEVRSVLLSHSPSPPASQRAAVPSSSVASHARSRSVSNTSTSGLSSVVGDKWTSQEWRRLEQSLVELKRRLKADGQGREVEAIEVLEAFLKKWGIHKEELRGDWEW
jgi:hypothetical protein